MNNKKPFCEHIIQKIATLAMLTMSEITMGSYELIFMK